MIRTVFVHEFVTGGGFANDDLPPSWAAEGRAMRRALIEDFSSLDGIRVVMTLDARLPDEPSRWETVRVGPGEELDTFTRLSAECDLTLCVAPETGGVLESRARAIERAGGHSLGCSPDAIALCADKLRLAEHLTVHGIETPPSIRVFPNRDGVPHEHPYPAVLKPIDGAGCVATYFVESPDDPPPLIEALMQPFIPGRTMSAAFLMLPSAEACLIGLADQVIGRAAGRFSYEGGIAYIASQWLGGEAAPLSPWERKSAKPAGEGAPRNHQSSVAPPPSSAASRHLLPGGEGNTAGPPSFADDALIASVQAVPGLLGWVGVDFVWNPDTGQLTVLEINPRVTTSYVGFRHAAGAEARPSIAAEWLQGIVDPHLVAMSLWRESLKTRTPVAFSADGRVNLDGRVL